jgi:23S rRNA (adenine2503-C2)-methyltransferase
MLPAIQAHLPDEIAQAHGLDLGEVRRVVAGVQQRGQPLNLANSRISRRTSQCLAESYRIGRLAIETEVSSSLDPFVKYLTRAEDGALLETVRIPLEKAGCFSVCVSSQVGCGLGCRFCKTAQLGLLRNLEAWEIVEQVRLVRSGLPAGSRMTGVVFQGMGEPLANFEAVVRAIRVLSDPCGQSIDQKAMTVCTAGLPTAIRRLTQTRLRVRLALSVGCARPARRSELMPITQRFPLSEVADALIEHALATRQAPMLSYTLIRSVNTSPDDAIALRELALRIGAASGRMPRVSLIPYNSQGPEDVFQRATESEAEAFRLQLVDAGFPVVRRYSGGIDISAGCGQLAAMSKSPVRESPAAAGGVSGPQTEAILKHQ